MAKKMKLDNIWGINEQQRAFADYYIQGRNASQAYKLAYGRDLGKKVKDTTAHSNSYKLLREPKVKAYIDDRLACMLVEEKMASSEILIELTKIAMDKDNTTKERMNALELLGKEQAMWVDKSENSNTMDIEINLKGLSEKQVEED